jgi:hypothetical protein
LGDIVAASGTIDTSREYQHIPLGVEDERMCCLVLACGAGSDERVAKRPIGDKLVVVHML